MDNYTCKLGMCRGFIPVAGFKLGFRDLRFRIWGSGFGVRDFGFGSRVSRCRAHSGICGCSSGIQGQLMVQNSRAVRRSLSQTLKPRPKNPKCFTNIYVVYCFVDRTFLAVSPVK